MLKIYADIIIINSVKLDSNWARFSPFGFFRVKIHIQKIFPLKAVSLQTDQKIYIGDISTL